jgi:lysophospholipase L1-like esterase
MVQLFTRYVKEAEGENNMEDIISNTVILCVFAFASCMVNVCDAASFEEFDKRALEGEKLTVAFLGGSLTWGAGATDPQKTSYRAIVSRKLKEAYPKAHFCFVDAAIGGSGAQLGAFRLKRDVQRYEPDLMFLDFTLNDGAYRTTTDTLAAHESIIRRMITENNCPVIQMFLASRGFVTEKDITRMKRRTAHIKLARTYNVPCGYAITHMQKLWKQGNIDLDNIWPPALFDRTHPDDPGYILYAEAAWNAFRNAVANKTVCKAPQKTVFSDRYMNWARISVSSLDPLPEGWRVTYPNRNSVAFDFLMSRWLDDVSVASNFTEKKRGRYEPADAAGPLKIKFSGSTVLLFGESTLRSCCYRVLIDGKPGKKHGPNQPAGEFDAARLARACKGNAPLWQVVAEGLDPGSLHTLEIIPMFEGPDTPGELRIESICIAGGRARIESK